MANIKSIEIVLNKETAKQAFEAGRERIKHPDYDFVYEDFEDWWSELQIALAKRSDESSGLHLQNVGRSLNHLSPKASYIQCDKCGRKSKSEKVNKVCGMVQPNGSYCDGWLMGL